MQALPSWGMLRWIIDLSHSHGQPGQSSQFTQVELNHLIGAWRKLYKPAWIVPRYVYMSCDGLYSLSLMSADLMSGNILWIYILSVQREPNKWFICLLKVDSGTWQQRRVMYIYFIYKKMYSLLHGLPVQSFIIRKNRHHSCWTSNVSLVRRLICKIVK